MKEFDLDRLGQSMGESLHESFFIVKFFQTYRRIVSVRVYDPFNEKCLN